MKEEEGRQDKIIDKEIDSWNGFEYALREEIGYCLVKCYLNVSKMEIILKQLSLEANVIL
jgi:hypothetical protein